MTQGSRQGNNRGVAGLALAGGRSSRFGSEKAIAMLAGETLLGRVVATLRETCEIIAVSTTVGGGAYALARAVGLPVVTDDPLYDSGPLAGLAAGLAWAQAQGFTHLVSLPCDTPLAGAREILALTAALGDAPAAYAATADGPQPLCAAWRTDLAGVLGVRLTFGRHPAVRSFLREIGAIEVAFADPRPFRNANSPAALADMARDADLGR